MDRESLGPYEILEPLGSGGMGEVYRARDTRLGREVALKLVGKDRLEPADRDGSGDLVDLLLREARTAASLNHPHICTVHDVGEEGGHPYIGMELVEGETLASSIPAGGLPSETVIRLGIQIAGALSHAHDRGVVHRDLKCGNVMITHHGDAKVLDFGLAFRFREADLDKIRSTDVTLAEASEGGDAQGGVAGTLAYMAPEVLRGEGADERSDLWALGVVLYEAATGELPFSGRSGFELTSAILKDPCPDLPGAVPGGLAAVIRRCLSKEPGRRYRNAGEVQSALEMSGSGGGITQAEAGRAGGGQRRGEATSVRAMGIPYRALGAIALLLALGVVAFVWNLGGVRGLLPGPGAAGTTPEIRSLAVLPLENLAPDPEAEQYFADGMTEVLTAELSQISALKVISRTSAMLYRGTDKSSTEIAQELGVEALVEGSVLRAGDEVRITLQLVHGPTDQHLWSEIYERDVSDILALQGDVARAVAEEIRVEVTRNEAARLASSRRVDPEAYTLHLRGAYELQKDAAPAFQRALQYFQQALAIDSTYAPAWAGLAVAYIELGSWSGSLPPPAVHTRARDAATRALEEDSTLAEAHIALARIKHLFEWDWEGAEESFRRGIALNPSAAYARNLYMSYLISIGRFQETVDFGRRTLELAPRNPRIYITLGWALERLGRGSEARASLERALTLPPELPWARVRLANLALRQGRFDEALTQARRAEALPGSADSAAMMVHIAYAYATVGQRDEALRILDELETQAETKHVPLTHFGAIHVALGHEERALELYEQAFEARELACVWYRVHFHMDPLRDEPRFQELIRRMGFPEE